MNILGRTLQNFTFLTVTTLLLNGCFLVSDMEIVKKGSEVELEPGEYLLQSLDLSGKKKKNNPDYSKLKRKINEPNVVVILEKKEGGLFSKSYTYQITNKKNNNTSSIKFIELDHESQKNIYLAQIKDMGGLTGKKSPASPEYVYTHARIKKGSGLSIFSLFDKKANAEKFFASKSLTAKPVKGAGKMDLGIRKINGDPEKLSKALIEFASTNSSSVATELAGFKKMCAGKQNKWNSCIGRDVSEEKKEKQEIKTVSIGPYVNGVKNGEFYRYQEFKNEVGGKVNIRRSVGLFSNGEQSGWWHYKWKDSEKKKSWVRSAKLESKKIIGLKERYKTNGVFTQRFGTVFKNHVIKEGLVMNKNGSVIGQFTEAGQLSYGSHVFKNGRNKTTSIGKFGELGIEFGTKKFSETKCEHIGKFSAKKGRNNTVTSTLEAGMTKCARGQTRIGQNSQLCDGNFGGPMYVIFRNGDEFYGSTNANCSKYDRGIYIEKRTGKSYAVKLGNNGFKRIKEVDLNLIITEAGLR